MSKLADRKGTRRMVSLGRLGFKRLGLVALAGMASLALAGCISFGPKVPEQLLSLAPDSSAQAGPATTGSLTDAIVLIDPEADRSLDMLRVPVRVNASTIAYLQDIAWVEKPAHQFRSLLAETLRTRTSRLVVEDGDFDVAGRTQVTGRLLAMGYDAPTSSVVVRLDMQRQEKGGAITSRRFEAVVPGIAAKAAPVATALGQASNDVAKQVAAWIVE
jgi:cholesterol transport system auxiliary component